MQTYSVRCIECECECVSLSYSVHIIQYWHNAWKHYCIQTWRHSVHTDPVQALQHNLLHFIVVKMYIAALQSMRYELVITAQPNQSDSNDTRFPHKIHMCASTLMGARIFLVLLFCFILYFAFISTLVRQLSDAFKVYIVSASKWLGHEVILMSACMSLLLNAVHRTHSGITSNEKEKKRDILSIPENRLQGCVQYAFALTTGKIIKQNCQFLRINGLLKHSKNQWHKNKCMCVHVYGLCSFVFVFLHLREFYADERMKLIHVTTLIWFTLAYGTEWDMLIEWMNSAKHDVRSLLNQVQQGIRHLAHKSSRISLS